MQIRKTNLVDPNFCHCY